MQHRLRSEFICDISVFFFFFFIFTTIFMGNSAAKIFYCFWKFIFIGINWSKISRAQFRYLSRAQEALEATVDVVRENADDLNVIETHLKWYITMLVVNMLIKSVKWSPIHVGYCASDLLHRKKMLLFINLKILAGFWKRNPEARGGEERLAYRFVNCKVIRRAQGRRDWRFFSRFFGVLLKCGEEIYHAFS